MKEGYGSIYQILNLTNGKFYVGSTVDIKDRWRTHRRKLRNGTHHCPHLQASWNKHGEDSFSFNVLSIHPVTELDKIEQQWLDEHHGSGKCYNFAKFVDSATRGTILQEKHKKAISQALKEFYAKNPSPILGRKHSEESKALMSQNRRNKPVSESTKEKLRQANLGKKASEETKKKLSQVRKGRIKSSEHVAKYNKQIIEVVSGQIFPSLKVVKETFSMSPGQLAKALKADRPLAKGKNAGKHFKYLDTWSKEE
jgi:group I intron endonuclease